jgi:hypothetical protein
MSEPKKKNGKNNPSKYEEKLSIKGDFHELMKILAKSADKKAKEKIAASKK